MKAAASHNPQQENESHRGNFIQRAMDPMVSEKEEIPFVSAKRLGIQAKLTIGTPNDPYEKEADAMAEHVMRMPLQHENAPMISNMPTGLPVRGMCADCEEEMPIQRFESSGGETHASSYIANRIQSRQDQGSPLPTSVQTQMGLSFGTNFSNVRIHTDTEAAQISQDLNAQAFTHGSDIYFNQGKYNPETSSGKKLLAHELTHTVQQDSHTHLVIQQQVLSESSDMSEVLSDAQERIRFIEQDLLSLGITPSDVGTVQGLYEVAHWEPEHYQRIRSTLVQIKQGGRRLGGYGRIIRAWNSHLDDLGAGSPYPTILHYIEALQGYVDQSIGGGMSYLTAIQEANMPTVRIAGAQVGVNPRVVYFVAAAQVGMDQRATDQIRQGGHGHYIPAGGFRTMLVSIVRMLRQLAHVNQRRRPLRRTVGLPNSRQIFNIIISQLQYMVQVLQAQEEGRSIQGHNPEEHREPALRSYFFTNGDQTDSPTRVRQINALESPADDNSVPAAAEALLGMLEDIPGGSEVHHGFGSIDPHGTDHALGLAIDLYNGRGRGGSYQNFGINDDTFWTFIYALIDRYFDRIESADLENDYRHLNRTLRPRAIHQLTPEQARDLARLIIEEGQTFGRTLIEEAQQRRTPRTREPISQEERQTRQAQNDTRQEYRQLLQGTRRVLSLTTRILNQLKARAMRNHFTTEFQRRIGNQLNETRGLIHSVQNLSPYSLRDLLRCQIDAFERFQIDALSNLTEYAQLQDSSLDLEVLDLLNLPPVDRRINLRRSGGSTRRTVRRHLRIMTSRSRTRELLHQISSAISSLRELQTNLLEREDIVRFTTLFEQEQHEQLIEIAGRRVFSNWLNRVTDPDRPIYDQPSTLVAGIEDVERAHTGVITGRQTHFFGGHHWTVADRDEILGSSHGYQSAIYRDMEHRSVDELERILYVVAESAGGRRILFGERNSAGDLLRSPDSIFRQVLERRLENEPISTEEILNNVRERVVDPYDEMEGLSGMMIRELRDQGYYIDPEIQETPD